MTASTYILVSSVFVVIVAETGYKNLSCGIDNSPINVVFEGLTAIETYPWLGYLVYPIGEKRLTTVVVLVTKQVVLGTATEIDNLPKNDFRARASVVLGQNCSGYQFRVRDYVFHPDYGTNTTSALAMIQLNLDDVKRHIETLRPICPPPSHFIDPEFYAMTLSYDCNEPQVRIYEMKFVEPDRCKTYYRKSGLDIGSIWPTHTACARATHGGECLWRSGTALVVYQGRRWNLVGFGVHGPGCKAPARFLDYGMYHQWVRRSILRIGKPTITRIGDSEVILRRTLTNLQRFGLCDTEEMQGELYSDHTSVSPNKSGLKRVRYNMTVYASVEYSCVWFRATNFNPTDAKPKLRLRRWCAGPIDICSDHQHTQINFYVEITFSGPMSYDLVVYGRPAKEIDVRRAMWYVNNRTDPVEIPDLEQIQAMVSRNGYTLWYRQDNQDDEQLLKERNETGAVDSMGGPSIWGCDKKGDQKLHIDEVWAIGPIKTQAGRLRQADNVVHCVDSGYT